MPPRDAACRRPQARPPPKLRGKQGAVQELLAAGPAGKAPPLLDALKRRPPATRRRSPPRSRPTSGRPLEFPPRETLEER